MVQNPQTDRVRLLELGKKAVELRLLCVDVRSKYIPQLSGAHVAEVRRDD